MMQMRREPQRGLPERSFLSIGDVLDLIREEFPEITISKIRFLESQGLVNPERTPSGYRKFYEEDVERLKWVLRQQREHYLPLKVIRGKLQHETSAASVPRQRTSVSARTGAVAVPGHYGAVADQAVAYQDSMPEDNTGYADHAAPAEVGGGRSAICESSNGSAEVPYPAGAQADVAQAATSVRAKPERLSGANTNTHVPPGRLQGPSTVLDAPATTSQPVIQPTINLLPSQEEVSGEFAGDGRSDAANNTSQPAGDRSLPTTLLNELESFGLISGERIGGVITYGQAAMEISDIAASIMSYGFEARHLRMFKHAVEREVSIIEQAIVPLLKQRNPGAREKARNVAKELMDLAERLHCSLLRDEVDRFLPRE